MVAILIRIALKHTWLIVNYVVKKKGKRPIPRACSIWLRSLCSNRLNKIRPSTIYTILC
jgi:hypothetical protein